jgi:CPA2 family monovalent cation:H+ antiporter-2
VFTRGEFSLILASLAVTAGLDPRVGAFTAGYVLVLAIIGPLAVTWSGPLAGWLPAGWFVAAAGHTGAGGVVVPGNGSGSREGQS